jgi:hypothetical protein
VCSERREDGPSSLKESTKATNFGELRHGEVRSKSLLRNKAMYACNRETGCGFFEGVCALATPALESSDPPPPRNAEEPEPHCQGSGPKWITHHATVEGALSWGRGKPPPA